MAEESITDIASQRAKQEAAKLNGESEREGSSIEEMAAELPEDEEGQQLLDFGDQLNLSLKGKRPTRSQIKIRPVSRDITGQIGDKSDDETYVFVIVGRLHKIEIPYERDEPGRVIGKTRRHILDPVDIQRVPDEMAEDLLTRLNGSE